MYKAIKDNKIIAISDTDSEFFCLVKDSVETDETHVADDYAQYNGEYLLKSEMPAPTQEEQRAARESAFVQEADPLRYAYEEDAARYGVDSEQALTSKEIWLAKKDEIRQRYPYADEEPAEDTVENTTDEEPVEKSDEEPKVEE